MSASPPALMRWLLGRFLPAEIRNGAARAGLWYACQVLAISSRFAAERLREALPFKASSLALDLKLGFRMLVKYPMLTLVAGIAITTATAIGVGGSEFVRDMIAPSLPLEDGDRIVRLYQIDSEAGASTPASLYDLDVWRESISSLQDLGAYTTMEQGFTSDRGGVGTVSLARISASAFRLTLVPPLFGAFPLRRRRGPGGATRGGAGLQRVADAPSWRSGRDRADSPTRGDAHHRGRGHAGGTRLPANAERVGALPRRPGRHPA